MIDPLADGLDLAPFLALLADPKICKVFHAARQDLEIFYKLMGKVPGPLFDSQIAAMACGFGDQIGYEPLMRELVNARIDKASRFTDWSRRPLTDAQLEYALSDVTYLREAYPILQHRLQTEQREHWVRDEMAVLDNPALYYIDPEQAWRRLKLKNIKPKELGPLVKLAEWRETAAQKRDVPRNRIMKDDGLFELARLRPRDSKTLARARSIGNGFEKSEAAGEILAAIAEGVSLPMEDLPEIARSRQLPAPPADVLELLRVLLKTQCEAHDVAPKLVASSADLEALARHDTPSIPAMQGWRFEIFGNYAVKLKKGEIGLKLNKNRVVIE